MIIMKFKGMGEDDIRIHKFKHFDRDSDHFNDAMKDFRMQFEDGGEWREKLNEAMKSLQLYREEHIEEDIEKAMEQLEELLEDLPQSMKFGENKIIIRPPMHEFDIPEFDKERQRELQREMHRMQKEKHRMQQEQQNMAERMYQRHLELPTFAGRTDIQSIMEQQLIRDGFVQHDESYKFTLKSGKLKINGKKQPQGVYERYKDLYERHTNINLEDGSVLKLDGE